LIPFFRFWLFSKQDVRSLRLRHRSMSPIELARGFVKLGLELREHLSLLRDNGDTRGRVTDEEVNQLN